MQRFISAPAVLSAVAGVFLVRNENWGTWIVMGFFSALVGVSIASGVKALTRGRVTYGTGKVRGRGKRGISAREHVRHEPDFHPTQVSNASPLFYISEEDFPVACSSDPVARQMTGSPDLANLNRNLGY